MRTIGEILAGKRLRDVVTVGTGESVLEAVRRMDDANTGSVVVLEGNRLAGIFTERDLMRRVVLRGHDVASTVVSQVMTRDLIFTEPDEAGEEAMSKMTRHRCRHLPVVDGERLVGLVSIGDLMKEISDEQSVEIHFLKEYIYSR
ncbi:MAG TPA: CBS domain-containing protein [Candidatus Binatia bacterium]|nr:CBS domain-containing protein [Candidatus Binatia bacterium]